MTAMRGTVVKWFDSRGFGFVRADNGTRTFFVHASVIVGKEPYKSLVVGEPVEFELKPNPNADKADPVAAYVVRLNKESL